METNAEACSCREFGTRGEKIKYLVSLMPEKYLYYKPAYQAVGKALTRYGFDTTYFAVTNITESVVEEHLLLRLFHFCKVLTDSQKAQLNEQKQRSSVEAIKRKAASADLRSVLNEVKKNPDQYLLNMLFSGKISKEQFAILSGDSEAIFSFVMDTVGKDKETADGCEKDPVGVNGTI
jgi:hypothetical protein